MLHFTTFGGKKEEEKKNKHMLTHYTPALPLSSLDNPSFSKKKKKKKKQVFYSLLSSVHII